MVQRGQDIPARGLDDVALSEDGRVLFMGHKKGLVQWSDELNNGQSDGWGDESSHMWGDKQSDG